MSPRYTYDALNLFYFSIRLTSLFLLWTLAEYLLHRFMHINHSLNIFYHIHQQYNPYIVFQLKKNMSQFH